MSNKTMINAALEGRIRRTAAIVKWAAIAAMVGIVAVAAYSLTHQSTTWKTSLSGITAHAHGSPNAAADPHLGMWLELLPEAVLLYGFFRLVQMMRACERGEIFSSRAPAHLQAFSLTIIIVELLGITLPLQIAGLHALRGPVNFTFELTATGEQLWSLLLAVLFLVLAQILKESARLAEDNASIV